MVNKNVEDAKINAPTVLTWIPGINPVIVPHKTPIMHDKIRSMIFTAPIIQCYY